MPGAIRQTVTIDSRDAVRALDSVADAAGDAGKGLDDLDGTRVRVDADAAIRELADLDTEARKIADRKIELRAELDASGFDVPAAKVRKGADDAADAVKRIGTEAPSSAGALRDVSGAFGNMGGTSLDAAEGVMGLGESLAQLVPGAEGAAAALGKIGFVGAAGALAVTGLIKGLNALLRTEQQIAKATTELTAVLAQPYVDAEVAVRRFYELARAEQNKIGLSRFWESFGRTIQLPWQAASKGASDLTLDIESVDKAWKAVTKDSPAAGRALVNALLAAQQQMDRTGRSYKDTGDLITRYNQQLREQGEDQREVAAAANAAAQSTDGWRNRLEALAAAQDRANDTAAAAIQLTKDQAQAYDDASLAALDYDDKITAAFDALVGAQATLKDHKASLADQKQAVRDTARAYQEAFGPGGAREVVAGLAATMAPGSPIRRYTDDLYRRLTETAVDWYASLNLDTQGVDWVGLRRLQLLLEDILRKIGGINVGGYGGGGLPPGVLPFAAAGAGGAVAVGNRGPLGRSVQSLSAGRQLSRSVDRWRSTNGGR